MTITQPQLQTSPIEPSRFFHLDSEFRAKFHASLSADGVGELCMLDASGRLFDFGSESGCSALSAYLRYPLARARLITFEDAYIFAQCPRFLDLRERMGESKLDWRVAPASVGALVQESSAATRQSLIRKPVRESFHGYMSAVSADVSGHWDFFEQLWERCPMAPPRTPLGL